MDLPDEIRAIVDCYNRMLAVGEIDVQVQVLGTKRKALVDEIVALHRRVAEWRAMPRQVPQEVAPLLDTEARGPDWKVPPPPPQADGAP